MTEYIFTNATTSQSTGEIVQEKLSSNCSCFKYWSFSNKVFLKIKTLKKKKSTALLNQLNIIISARASRRRFHLSILSKGIDINCTLLFRTKSIKHVHSRSNPFLASSRTSIPNESLAICQHFQKWREEDLCLATILLLHFPWINYKSISLSLLLYRDVCLIDILLYIMCISVMNFEACQRESLNIDPEFEFLQFNKFISGVYIMQFQVTMASMLHDFCRIWVYGVQRIYSPCIPLFNSFSSVDIKSKENF